MTITTRRQRDGILGAPFTVNKQYVRDLCKDVNAHEDRVAHLVALLRDAHATLITATNNAGPDCIFCGNDATPEGERHGTQCIVSRIGIALAKAGKVSERRKANDDQLHAIVATMSPGARRTILRLCQSLVRTPKKGAKP